MAKDEQSEHICWICNKPVDLETTKADDRGKAVHEECYTAVCAFNNDASEMKLVSLRKLREGE